jgi:hypothetical protein
MSAVCLCCIDTSCWWQGRVSNSVVCCLAGTEEALAVQFPSWESCLLHGHRSFLAVTKNGQGHGPLAQQLVLQVQVGLAVIAASINP